MQTSRKLPGFEGVAAGQTATCRMPIGKTYHNIQLSGDVSDIDEARIVANGEVIRRWPLGGSQIDSHNQFNGRAASANDLIILDFDRYNMRTRAAEEYTAFGTGMPYQDNPDLPNYNPNPATTLSLELDIAAAAVAPAYSGKVMQSAARPTGPFLKTRNFVYGPTGAGDFEIADLPRGDLINKIYFHPSANAINSLKLEVDNFIQFERTALENDQVQADGVRVPQAGIFVFDPTELGNGSESLVTAGVSDLRFILNVTGAMSLRVAVEYIGTLED